MHYLQEFFESIEETIKKKNINTKLQQQIIKVFLYLKKETWNLIHFPIYYTSNSNIFIQILHLDKKYIFILYYYIKNYIY